MTCEHGPIEYETLHVPDTYHCGKCGALGVRLWRQSHTFADSVQLRCSACMAEDDVPAVPTPDGSTYWGCCSVPSDGDAWWRALPLEPGQPRGAFCLDPELQYEAQAAAARKRDDENVEAWSRETVYLVEATGFEKQTLWERWSTRSQDKRLPYRLKVVWQDLNPGKMACVGKVGEDEVWVTVFWARLAGKVVCFYDATSQVVDHRLVDAWVAKQWPNVPRTDADNFHNCIQAVRG